MSYWCDLCGGYKRHDLNHECLPKWKVWCPDDEDPGDDFEDTRTVYAHSEQEAAEKFAQLECSADPEYYSKYIRGSSMVAVRPYAGGDIHIFDVYGEELVEFHARELNQ